MSLESSTSGATGTARLKFKDKMGPADGDFAIGRDIRHLPNFVRLPDTLNKENANADETSQIAAPVTFQTGDSGQGVLADKDLSVQAPNQTNILHDAPVELILPIDHHPSDARPFAGALFPTQLENPLKLQLLNLAHHHNSDLATAVLAAWIVVLSRLSGQESIGLDVGSTDEAGTLGDLLSLNVDVSAELDTFQLLERVKLALGTTKAKALRSAVDRPIKTFKNVKAPRLSQAGFYTHTSTLVQSLRDPVSMQCYLELHLLQDQEDATATVCYAADLYNKDTIERYAGYLQAVLINMVTSKGRLVASFDILSTAERKLLLETWNETDAEYPSERCIHHLFEDQVEKSPDAVAIVHDEKEFTYLELYLMANHLAHQLDQAGVKPGDFVALLLERSIELVVAELAVLKTGAAYVPIDTRAPADRVAYIVSDTGAKLLVTKEGTSVLGQVMASVLRFDADMENLRNELDVPRNFRHSSASSLDTAYVMFTSGTTGVPKGVLVPHRAVIRAVISNGFTDIGPEDRVAFATSPSFSPSTCDLWSALLNGACVVIVDDDTKLNANRLEAALVRFQVTCLYITAPLLLQYAPAIGKTLSQLRYLLCGGEQVQVKAYSTVQQYGGPVHLINRYASTETLCAVIFTATCALDQLNQLPIGRPSSNGRMYVLDKNRSPVPIGVLGELYIGGPGIASGYLNLPDLTTERFLPDPFSTVPGARMYKSGDLARYLPDGNLMCVGRNDDLIKLRGYRVELGEIQTRLVGHPLVRNAAVIAVGEEDGRQLVAYVEADYHEQLIDTLREYLARMLPDYMIPAAFVCLDKLPLTSRGKIDRRALPNPDFSSSLTRNYVAPQGETEVALARMWSELLEIKRIGRHDNFFTLGGHSIMAMRLLNSIAATFGPQLPMSRFFASPTLQNLADAVSTSVSSGMSTHFSIPRISRDGPVELSYAQQRLWFLSKIGGTSENYHVHRALRLRGSLDHISLQRALNTLYVRHESIRCAFPTVDGQAVVQILPGSSGLPFVTLDIQYEQNQEAAVKQASLQERAAPFDMERGPLVRARLIKIAEGEHVFLISMHHIVTDGWSMGVMFREINMLYEAYATGQPDPLDPLPIQYPDYAAWQRQQLTQEKLRDQAAYWREALRGAPVSIELPTDRPRPSQQSFTAATIPMRFDPQLTRALKTLSQKHGVTMFMTILAAWSAVLSRLSGQDDIIIGTPSANRSHQQVEQLIGFFVSTLAIRIDLSEEPSTEQLLERVRKVTIAAQAHQDLPFEQVVEAVRPTRRTDINPIFQVMFAWQNNDVGTLDLKNVITVVEDIQANVLKFDLDLELYERNSEIVGGLKYSTALFDCETIDRHVGYLEAMLRWMTTDTKESINIAPILGPSERKLLLETWNATDKPYPDNSCLHQLFESQVEKSPEAIAIMHDDRTLTYRELNSRANWIAHQLVEAGVTPGDLVMLLLDRSIDLVASQIAVLKTGAAYVPLDPNEPTDRHVYVVSDCGSTVLITDESYVIPYDIQGTVRTVLRVNTKQSKTCHVHDNVVISREGSGTCSEDTAYVMYTSGSTGQPKGVVVHHRGVARLVINNGFAELCPNDRMAFTTNPAFDPSTYQVWAPLLHGASIVVIDNDTFLDPNCLAEALTRYQVTCLHMTHGILHQYAYIIGSTLSKLKYLLGGAEQGLIEAYMAVLQHGGPVGLVNRYGPTETTVSATAFTATGAIDKLKRLPIGRPISNTRVYILDKYLSPVPIGAVGELYICGAGVASGYLNRPELTEERFLPDPWAKLQGARMYKTGDMVRYLPDGNLVFIGRNDNQVKIRGYRVELGEIEARLAEHPQVHEAVVIALGESIGDKRLVAYVVAERHEDLAHVLREHLSISLPEYMIPSAFVRMDAFPLTNNGKINRRALPGPDNESFVTSDYVPPQGELEVALTVMWSELLQVERVGRHDNFFMLGGHSLLAVSLMNRVSSIGMHMPLSMLFSYPTPAALAKVVSGSIIQEEPLDLFIIPVTRDGPLELSLAQQRLWFLAQVDGFSEIYHVPFSSRLHGPLDHVALKKTLDTLFARHESLRTIFVTIEGEPRVQLLPPDNGLSLVIRNLKDEQDKEAIVKQAVEQNVRTPFDLEKGPLIRAQLIQIADDEHVFMFTMHHIITDGWSRGVMFRELNILYEAYVAGRPDPLKPLLIQYPDYAAWQRQQLTEDRLKNQAAYWRETLAGTPVSIDLPTDRSRPPQKSFAGASIPIRFDSKLTAALKALSQKHGVTMFMTILAAWSAVLSRLSGQDDIVIGTPSANRSHQQVEQLIGFFVSTLALRIDLSEEPSTERLLERVRNVTITAQAHQDLPFEQVVEVVRPPRRTDTSPLFQVMFAWQNNETGPLKLHNIEAVYEHREYRVAKYELGLSLREVNGEIVGGLNYSTALFDCETIDRHVGYLEAMLRWMVTDTEESINRAPILGRSERMLLLETWNITDQLYPDNSCLHQLFENQVEKSPEAIAIVHDERTLTYRELNSRANWIAHQLVEAGVTPGDLVMLLLDRSIDLVASQIAVLKIGAAYVPMDPNAPADRQVYVASDCESRVLITDESYIVPSDIQGIVLQVNMKQSNLDHVHATFVVNRRGPATSSKDTAYVMYTSGSTGQPKGVVVHHRGVARLVINNGFAELCPNDRMAFTTNPAFDPSTYQVWAPLLHGASIVVINTDTFLDPTHLAEALTRYQVTCMYMTHGILHQYAYIIGSTLSKLKYLLGGAEQGLIEAYMAVLQHGGPVRLVNRYGPTETTVSATAFTATGAIDNLERLPIGRPISNTRVYILDKYLSPVPIGAVGELYIGGAGVASGYLNRPELTEERFVPDPWAKLQGARMYKTGDMVRYLPDGNLVFIGRNDNQVKIRGYRVELGEIEARLAEHPQVHEAVVIALGEEIDDKRLVAYIVSEIHEDLAHALREHLSVSLPEYMIPSAFVRMDAFPLTNNGKIDRRALPLPDECPFGSQDYEKPQGKAEVMLARVWASLLQLDRISRHDNFFVLGGHSILAVRMVKQLRQQGYMLLVRVLFENPVLSALATRLHQRQAEAIVPLNLISLSTKALTPDLLPLIDLTQDDIDLIVHQVPGGVANIQDIYGLSPLQNGIVFHHIMATVGDPYLTVVCKAFRDKDLLDRYLDAFQQVVNRHDTLRTAIIWEKLSTPAQVVLRQATLSVVEHTLDPAAGPVVDQLMQMYNPQKHRIELSEAPLTRFAYAQDVDGRFMAIQLHHHLINDHTTLEVIGEEIEAILDARMESLPVSWPYRNLIAQTRFGANAEEHERFFHKMLHDIDSPSLPFGLSGVYGDGTDIAEFRCKLPQKLNTKLRDQAKCLGVSLATLCHLAWALVISATSGQSRVVFGTVLFGRTQGGKGSDRALGLFINTLPIRVDVEGAGILDSVRKVHADLAELLDHEHASLAAAQLCSSVPSGTSLFSSMLNYRHNSASTLSRRRRLGFEITTGQQRTNYPLGMAVEDFGSSLGLRAKVVNPYEPSRICGYMEQALHNLAESLEQSPDIPIQSLNVLPSDEYDLVIHAWNNTDAPYPSDRCIHQLFEDQTERTPDAIAVLHNDHSMTYRELNYCASHLARRLVHAGVRPGDHVAILLDRSLELIVAQLAILKVGAAYVPIDTHAPVERQGYIVSDCGAKLLVTDDPTTIPAEVNALVFTYRPQDASVMQDAFDSLLPLSCSSVDTAYVMYTSGSTGQPKGVVVQHRGVTRLVINNGFAELCPNDRMAFTTNPTFDPSTYQVWAPLLHGASIVVIDNDTFLDPNCLAEALTRYQVTCLHMTHGILHQYAYIIGSTLSKLKYLLGGAEQGLIEAYMAVLQHGGPVRLVNRYGPTETTVSATAYTATRAIGKLQRLPIGRPISNTRAYILDKCLAPVPIGVVGELYIGGPGVAKGYLNRPELTAERFLPDPFAKVQGARMYKTGDLVRYLPDGNLVFIGRNDNQVKIRGYRVELGEIEARLTEHLQVREALVLATGESSDDKRLIAYVVAAPRDDLVHILRDHLSTSLPEYMLPSAFVRMDAFPLTNNGKIDRRSLPGPDNDSFPTFDYVAPQGELEVALAAIWMDLLKVERIGRHDNFFLLGGHSLLAVRLMNRVSYLGMQLPLTLLFSCPTLRALAKAVSGSINQQDPSDSLIIPVTRDGPLELSLAQQRLWFLAQVDGFSEIYHVPFASRLRGPLDHVALKKTLDTLFARHESLRTIFVTIEGEPRVQLLPADHKLSLIIRDLRSVQDKEDIVKQVAEQTVRTPFDLEKGPLVRAQLIQIADDEHVFLITMHHIITDGWSRGVMFRELNILYEAFVAGRADPLEPLPVQYPDYAAWQRQQLTEDRLKDQAAYWRETLAGAPVSIDLPTDRSRPPQKSFAGASIPIRLDSQLTAALKALSQKHGVTMFMTILAAWSAVLSRLSGQDDIVIGTPSANRSHQQVEQLIGFFVSTLALRIDLSEEPSTERLLERVRKVTIAAQTHQDLPFEQVVEIVQPPRRTDISPLFQVMFAWQNNETGPLNLPNIEAVSEHRDYRVAKYELGLSLRELNGEIVGGLNYSTALFDRETIDRHVGYLEATLRWMATDIEESINRVPILGPTERKLLFETWNATDQPYPDSSCLHQLFENQVEMSPEAIAIVHNERTLTYRELNSRANWIAHQLVEAGVKSGDYVMLLLDRSIELVASQIAALKIGAAYVPIDINTPPGRQVFVVSDCGSTVLITDESTDVPRGIQATVLRLNTKQSKTDHVHTNFAVSREASATSCKDTAYVMYTSGSTGQPKGVMVCHQGIVNLIANNESAELGPGDVFAFSTNPAFDPSTYEIWASLVHGASVVVIDLNTYLDPHRLAEELIRRQVTHLRMSNGLLHQYAYLMGDTFSRLKYLFGGAEQGSCKAYSAILQHCGTVRLVNRYGPTETTVTATIYSVTSAIDKLERLPIGRPISNTRVYILDRHLTPVPIGVVGELYIGGAGVAKGYLSQPELTAERFLFDPFAEAQGARMYKTGDMIRYLPDGNLVFMGRNDNQSKIRGHRVELGEIEARLVEHPQVREAVVIALGEGGDDKRLVAYFVAEFHENLAHALREYLSVNLPEYMIPSAFVRMDSFPLTNNGKINRRALPEPSNDSFVTPDYVPPQGECEVALAAIWSDLLKIERVGRHDNFFMLGGHSLLAVRLINTIRSSLGVDLKLHTLFSAPSVSGLALLLDGAVTNSTQDDEYGVLLPLKPQGSRPPLFCVHPGQGLSWSYRDLAKHLHPEQPLYGLQCRGLEGKSRLASSIEEMTLDYIEHVRKVQPRGPYHLLGWSFGGKVAHNMAAVLQNQGECVPLLAIMDTTPKSPAHEEVESRVRAESTKYDEYLARLIGISPTEDALAFKRRVTPILSNNKRLAAHFEPLVYSGDILFFRTTAREKTSSVVPECWGPYVRGSIEVHDVECAHEEMDRPENIAVIGRITAAWIERLQQGSLA